jgi:hypothetical protein
MGQRVSRMRRRGRRALLWAGAVFLVVQMTAGLLIDRYGLRVRFPYAAKELAVLRERDRAPDVVAFGSSRFLTAVNPGIGEGELHRLTGDASVTFFCAAVPGGDLATSDYLLEQMLKLGIRPRVVVVEISPEFLAGNNEWICEHLRRQLTWNNLPVYLSQALYEQRYTAFVNSRIVPLCLHRYELWKETARLWDVGWERWRRDYCLSERLARTSEPPADAPDGRDRCRAALQHSGLSAGCRRLWTAQVPPRAGWDPSAMNPRGEPIGQASIEGTDIIRHWLRHYEIGGLAAAALERLLARCHHHGIVPVLVVPPFASVQRALYTDDINHRFDAHLERLRQRYPFALGDLRGCLPDDRLVDNHHVSDAGAEDFTVILTREMLAPLWRGVRKDVAR